MAKSNGGVVKTGGAKKCSTNCLKCCKYVKAERRVAHILQHVVSDTGCSIFLCLECEFATHTLKNIRNHVKNHIKNKEKKNDEMEIKQLYSEEWKEHEKVIDEMAISCFDCPFEVVKKVSINGSKICDDDEEAEEAEEKEVDISTGPVPIDEEENAEAETTPEREMFLPTIKDETFFEERLNLDSRIIDGYLRSIVKIEDDVIYLSDDEDDDQKMEQEETQSLLSASSTSVNQGVFNNYRLEKEWDTEELIANMRVVGDLLKFSKNNIDIAMDFLRENAMDGASMFYEDENLSGFFKQCPVVYGVKTMIIKTLQAMRGG